MNEAHRKELLEKAAHYRELAKFISDAQARIALVELAAEFEHLTAEGPQEDERQSPDPT